MILLYFDNNEVFLKNCLSERTKKIEGLNQKTIDIIYAHLKKFNKNATNISLEIIDINKGYIIIENIKILLDRYDIDLFSKVMIYLNSNFSLPATNNEETN